jgi:hypothetical protein
MIIIWGTRHYGKVDGHGSEYMSTRFAHLYFFPIFPIESRWVTRRLGGDQLLGYDMPLSGRSVLATYLRFWAPLVALGVGATMTIWGIAAAAVLLGLSGWSWTWSKVRGRELRRAQLNQIAFMTACDPLRRPTGQCIGLRREIEPRFADASNGRTPDDVARLGADTPAQAALAYGCLRIVAATAEGRTAKKAREASERVLDRMTEREVDALAEGGPYRTKPAVDATPVALEAEAANAMNERDRIFDGAMAEVRVAAEKSAWDNSPDNPAVKEEIARNKAKRKFGLDLTRRGWALLIVGTLVAVPAVGYAIYDDQRDAKKALAELNSIADDICACETRECVQSIIGQHSDEEFDRLEGDAVDGMFIDESDVEHTADRAKSCITDIVSRDR